MCNLSFSRKIGLEKHIESIHKNDQNKEIAVISKRNSPEAKQGIKSQEFSNIDGKTASTVCLRSNGKHRISSKKQKNSGKIHQTDPKIDSNKKGTDRLPIFVEDEFI